MEYHMYLLFFVLGLITFYLSTFKNKYDLSNTYQIQVNFLNILIWVAVLYSSFNIEYIVFDGGSFVTTSEINYAYMGIAFGLFNLSLINIFILYFYGSYNRLFGLKNQDELK